MNAWLSLSVYTYVTLACVVLLPLPLWAQTALENPTPGSFQSGIGLVSGWACDAQRIEISFDGGSPKPAAYGTGRGDTRNACGDTDNGFGLLFNWNLLGDGFHTVVAYADGVEFARADVTVTTLGAPFRRGLSGEFPLPDFPEVGTDVVVRWQEAQQNFVISNGSPQGGGTSGQAPHVLENPTPGSFQSGIGLVSGWACDAQRIEISFDGGSPKPAAYGTGRGDTRNACGDTDNGFGLLFNWNLLGDGFHTVVAYADGVEFARADVTVTTLGAPFRRGLSGEFPLPDFPEVGTDVVVRWQEAQQNFVIVSRTTLGSVVLKVDAPGMLLGFFADVRGALQPAVRYTGEDQLSFALTTAPTGMEIDFGTGTITWTPAEADAGRTFDVTVEVGDGVLFDSVDFQVSVLTTTPVQTELSNGVLTVTDESTTLKGLSIVTTPPGAAAQSTSRRSSAAASSSLSLSDLRIETTERDAVLSTVPAHITLISDFFVVRQAFARPVELTFPLEDLPAGTDIRNVELFSFIETLHSDQPFWSPVLVDWRYEVVNDEPAYIVSLEGLQGIFAFGIQPFVDGETATQSQSMSVGTYTTSKTIDTSDITCSPGRILLVFGSDYRNQTCSHGSDSAVRIRVKNFGESENSKRWGVDIKTLIAWVRTTQEGMRERNFAFSKELTVSVYTKAPPIDGLPTLGFVEPPAYNTLHLNAHVDAEHTITNDQAFRTTAHEYFHHAQSYDENRIQGLQLIIKGPGELTDWLIEGSADWFDNEIHPYPRRRIHNILNVGLNAPTINDGDLRTFPYDRLAFFALLSQKCTDFGSSMLKQILSVPVEDSSGIKRLSAVLSQSQCNFEPLGSDLEAALLYYQNATVVDTTIEEHGGDEFRAGTHLAAVFTKSTHLTFDRTSLEDTPSTKGYTFSAVSARTFKLDVVSSTVAAEQKLVEVSVNTSTPVIVSVVPSTSDGYAYSQEFSGAQLLGRDHEEFSTETKSTYTFNAPSSPGEKRGVLMTIVNSDLEQSTKVDFTVRIVGSLTTDIAITSHGDGDSVNNRVVSIAGAVPEEARTQVTRVVVSANGVDTETTLNADGSFSADVVMTVGPNAVSARAFNGQTPVTNETVITLYGEESSSIERNALLPSRVTFVLRWDTAETDIDLYSIDKNNGAVWYADSAAGSGSLDFDDTSGFGPEVITYRENNDDIYVNGMFNVDVHYYSGTPATNYTLDIVLNETGSNRRVQRYKSIVPLTVADSGQDGPDGSGASRFNDVLLVACSTQRICRISGFDDSKLAPAGRSASSQVAEAAFVGSRSSLQSQSTQPAASQSPSAYESCLTEFEIAADKTGGVSWMCNGDGTKRWLP